MPHDKPLDIRPGIEYHFICSNLTDQTPAYVYTIGLGYFDLPELFISGNMEPETAMGILKQVIDRCLHELDDRLGRDSGKIQNFLRIHERQYPIQLVEVDPIAASVAYTTMLPTVYGEKPYRLVQVFWPDHYGELPASLNYSKEKDHRQHTLRLLSN